MRLTNPTEIKSLLARHGFHFSKAMGQNFLTASWVVERTAAEAPAGAGVLEIGPGLGCLTAELAKAAKRVVAVELDRRLEPLLAETVSGFGNVEIIFADALKLDLRAVAEEKLAGMRRVVCANLPYNITTPLLTRFLECGAFERVIVMVQREVAGRICARPGTPEYGAFTVFTNWYAEPCVLFDVPPGCFTPQPRVFSSVIRLDIRKAAPVKLPDEAMFFRVVRGTFAQRRKTLLNALTAAFGGRSRDLIATTLSSLGIDGMVRGETLDITAFAAIANALTAALRPPPAGSD